MVIFLVISSLRTKLIKHLTALSPWCYTVKLLGAGSWELYVGIPALQGLGKRSHKDIFFWLNVNRGS